MDFRRLLSSKLPRHCDIKRSKGTRPIEITVSGLTYKLRQRSMMYRISWLVLLVGFLEVGFLHKNVFRIVTTTSNQLQTLARASNLSFKKTQDLAPSFPSHFFPTHVCISDVKSKIVLNFALKLSTLCLSCPQLCCLRCRRWSSGALYSVLSFCSIS
jgi:hypothetical protein